MQKFSFVAGVVLALALSLVSPVLFSFFRTFLPEVHALNWLVAMLTSAYITALLARSQRRQGRVIVFCVLIFLQISWLYWITNPLVVASLNLGFSALARCFFYYRRLLVISLDMGLSTLGLLVSLWSVQHNQSLFLAVWCYFLVQAAVLPCIQFILQRTRGDRAVNTPRFEHALRVAEAALRRATLKL